MNRFKENRRLHFALTAIVLGTLFQVGIVSAHPDTLTAFRPVGTLRHYTLPGLALQAARFPLTRIATLTRITVILGGDSALGSARVRVFGSEAGAPVPFQEIDLIDPITVRKSVAGLETIDVVLPEPLILDGHQFFIAVDEISAGVLLVSDGVVRPAFCRWESDEFTSQCLKLSTGRWWTAPRGFAINAVIEYPEREQQAAFRNATEKSGLADTAVAIRSLASADLDRDGDLDLFIGGRLYRNDGNASFTDVTIDRGLDGVSRAGAFLDANGDMLPDLLLVGGDDSTMRSRVDLYIGSVSGAYAGRTVDAQLVGVPTSISIADVTGDQVPDVFIGTSATDANGASGRYLLIGDGGGGFVNRSSAIPTSDGKPYGSQWIDADDDGFKDLFVTVDGNAGNEIWRNNGDGTFSLIGSDGTRAPGRVRTVNPIGAHGKDIDGDGRVEIISAPHTTMAQAFADVRSGSESVLPSIETGVDELLTPVGIEFAERRGAGSWSDIDNDGHLEVMVAAGSACRCVDLYRRTDNGKYHRATAEAGLLGASFGPDALWADLDNDGRLDFLTFVDGKPALFMNQAVTSGSFVAFDVPGNAAGTHVAVHSGSSIHTDELALGRGLLMQDPPRLHIGLGDDASIDSIVVRWPTGESEVRTNIAINGLYALERPREALATHSVLSGVRIYPNPFSENVGIAYRLSRRERILIEILELSGRRVITLVNESQDAGVHETVWRALDSEGDNMPQGVYVYRITAGSQTEAGKVVLRR